MKYLLYCIFANEEKSPAVRLAGAQRAGLRPRPYTTVRLTGVDGQPIMVVSHNGLGASVSPSVHPNLTPDITRIQAYQRIIERFNHDRTVIPMRYGCLFPDKEEVGRYLGQRAHYYLSLLSELKGSVEMGIRVMMSEAQCPPGPTRRTRPTRPTGPNTQFPRSGKQYLSARKAHYSREDRNLKEIEHIIAQIRSAFSGLFVRFKSELAPTGLTGPTRQTVSPFSNRVLSLYFLVRRASVESFRQAFRRVSKRGPHKLLLSGPWPPYNFVTPERPDEVAWIT